MCIRDSAEALRIARVERCIAITEPQHRADQSLLSVLWHKHLAPLVQVDAEVYIGWKSPTQVRGQKIWVQRRRMNDHDILTFQRRIGTTGQPHMPAEPRRKRPRGLKEWYWALLAWSWMRRNRKRGQVPVFDGVRDKTTLQKIAERQTKDAA